MPSSKTSPASNGSAIGAADSEDVRARLPERPTFAEAIETIYRLYAESQGKSRFGEKTPLFMQHLDALERAFPGARYVHIVRHGRDAALSLLAMRVGRASTSGARGNRRLRVRLAARGRAPAVRPVASVPRAPLPGPRRPPEARLREIGAFLDLEFEPGMLEYHRREDPSLYADHPRLAEPPLRDMRSWWRKSARRRGALRGDRRRPPLRSGYERARSRTRGARRGPRRAGGDSNALGALAHAPPFVRKSPLWRARQVYIRRSR